MNNIDAEIVCTDCGNKKFELRFVVFEGIRSIVAVCSCGRVVEYRGVERAIDLTGLLKSIPVAQEVSE